MIRTLLIVLFFSFRVCAQPEYALVNTYETKARIFTTDQLGNIYFQNNSQLSKIDALTQKQFSFNQSEMNFEWTIDAMDPLRVLIFNKDFNKIRFLDNRLAELREPLDLNGLGYYQVASVCQSNHNGFWIFDKNLYELIYFDRNLVEQKKSSEITSLLDPEKEIQEISLLEKNDYIYLGIEGQGVFLFDVYGTYIKTYPIYDLAKFQVIDHYIVYYKNDKLFFYNTKDFNKEVLDLPVKDVLNARIEDEKIYILKKDKLYVFKEID